VGASAWPGLWPEGKFTTVGLIVRTEFLKDHPDVVERLLVGNIAAVQYVNDNAEEAQSVVNAGIAKLTRQALPPDIVAGSWNNMTFTFDPLPATLKKMAADAQAAGCSTPASSWTAFTT
jgi:NitT/TauT family transport system substrate-binding protein